MKKVLAILLVLGMVLAVLPAGGSREPPVKTCPICLRH